MLLALVVSWTAITGTLIAVAKLVKDFLGEEGEAEFGGWLFERYEKYQVPDSIRNWPATFAGLFDWMFTSRHLSLRCIFRSCIASLVGVVIITVFFYAQEPERFAYGPAYQERWRMLSIVFASGIVLNLVPDYLSLLETRWVLSRMAKAESNKCIFGWLLFDFFATATIFAFFFFVASFALQQPFLKATGFDAFYFSRLDELGLNLFNVGLYAPVYDGWSFLDANIKLQDVFGIFLYSTFLTSIWVWLFLAGAALSKALLGIKGAFELLCRYTPVEKKPIQFATIILILAQTLLHGGGWMLRVANESELRELGNADALSCPITEMRLVRIPSKPKDSREYSMGSANSRWNDERPVHRVWISDSFYMGQTEVTQDQWLKVMGENNSHFEGDLRRPVEGVNWKDAEQFIAGLNKRLETLLEDSRYEAFHGYRYRLPTEAEWEYSCRAGSNGRFSCPDLELNRFAWSLHNSGGETHSVGQKLPNAWGLYDMHGNVWEWCEDVYDSKAYQKRDAVVWKARALVDDGEGSERVLRGGGWNSPAEFCRSAYRDRGDPSSRYDDVGFRVVLARSSGERSGEREDREAEERSP